MDWPVLASLPPQERSGPVARLRRRSYHRDEVILHQGDPADTLHLIAAGHVSVRATLRGGHMAMYDDQQAYFTGLIGFLHDIAGHGRPSTKAVGRLHHVQRAQARVTPCSHEHGRRVADLFQ